MKCFYCKQPEDDAHLYGCPAELGDPYGTQDLAASEGRREEGGETFHTRFDEAVREFMSGFEDGSKEQSLRKPSEHPSYRLALSLSLAKKGGGA